MKCTLISPVWTPIGQVTWHGSSAPEKLYTIDRVACGRGATEVVESGGLVFELCAVHAGEVESGKLFAFAKGAQ
jgi:hypothetical protein